MVGELVHAADRPPALGVQKPPSQAMFAPELGVFQFVRHGVCWADAQAPGLSCGGQWVGSPSKELQSQPGWHSSYTVTSASLNSPRTCHLGAYRI